MWVRNMAEKVCVICGKPLPPKRRKYCSEQCQRAAEKNAKHPYSGKPRGNPDAIWTTQCVDCGKTIICHIRSFRCTDCQHAVNARRNAARQRNGPERPLGTVDICQNCGKPYIVTGGLQKYCKACASVATRKATRAHKREYMAKLRADPETNRKMVADKRVLPSERTCKYCGKAFSVTGSSIYCSDECRNAAKREYYARYDAARVERRREYNRERWAKMTQTQEQRDEANAKARANYAKRKAAAAAEQSKINRNEV